MLYLTRIDFVVLVRQGNKLSKSSRKEHHDHEKTTRAPSHGSLWSKCLQELGGNSFGLVIVDDFSRFTWVFFLDDKS